MFAICPRCPRIILGFEIVRSNSIFAFKIDCICSNEAIVLGIDEYLNQVKELSHNQNKSKCHNHISQSASHYCVDCSKWLCQECLKMHLNIVRKHVFSDTTLDILCYNHRKIGTSFCFNCNYFFCKKCNHDKTHVTHPQNSEESIKSKLSLVKEINYYDIMDMNQKYYEDFIEWITASNLPIESLRVSVNEAYSSNCIINNQFASFLSLINDTTGYLFNLKPCFLYTSLLKLQMNKIPQLNLSKDNLEQSAELLKKYYNEEYILIVPQNKPKVKKTNQHTYKCLNSRKVNAFYYKLLQLEDGRLVSCELKGMIKLWDISVFECLKSLKAHEGCAFSLIQLQDGRIASGGGKDQLINIWDSLTYKHLNSIKAHLNWVFTMIQLIDGRLISGGEDRLIKVWDSTTFECLKSFQAHSDCVSTLIQLKDGRLMSGGGEDKMIKCWDVNTFECIKSFEAHLRTISAMIQLVDERIVSGGYDDKMIKIWNCKTFDCIKSFEAHFNWVLNIIQLNDSRLVSSGADKLIKIWNINQFNCEQTLQADCNWVYSIIQLQDGMLVSTSSNDTIDAPNSSIQKWDI